MNAGILVIDAVKYWSVILKDCSGAWILKRWHQQSKALISLVLMMGHLESFLIFSVKSPLENKQTGPNYFHFSFWCYFIYHKYLSDLEPLLELKMTDEQDQKVGLLQNFLLFICQSLKLILGTKDKIRPRNLNFTISATRGSPKADVSQFLFLRKLCHTSQDSDCIVHWTEKWWI